MTTHQLADTLERCSAALRQLPDAPLNGNPVPMLDGEYAVGAALFWSYLRDLFTGTPIEQFSRDKILVMLEMLSRDPEMFPPGLVELVAGCEKEAG